MKPLTCAIKITLKKGKSLVVTFDANDILADPQSRSYSVLRAFREKKQNPTATWADFAAEAQGLGCAEIDSELDAYAIHTVLPDALRWINREIDIDGTDRMLLGVHLDADWAKENPERIAQVYDLYHSQEILLKQIVENGQTAKALALMAEVHAEVEKTLADHYKNEERINARVQASNAWPESKRESANQLDTIDETRNRNRRNKVALDKALSSLESPR